MDKPMTLPCHDYRDKSSGTRRRVLPPCGGGSVVVRGADAGLLGGCDGAPSRNILGSYFPSWMVCALVGIALALVARAIFKASGLLEELPVPFVVMLSIACAGTFAMWLIWLS